ncbi:MAG TPA: TetR family transcriptional regulator [Solirubrobacteraceae bacterium]|nr:TetR family transcriptional regulator [Solirubrobacteraceae bacterium]
MSARRGHNTAGAARDGVDPRRNGSVHEQVSGIQRTRLLTALAQVCAEHGAANVTVAHIVERAGVSRRTFYELFSDREDCFLAGLEEGLARIAVRVIPAYERPEKWRERVRAALIELLSFLDNDPVTGRLVIVETLGAGREALRRREHVLAQVIDAVHEGRLEAKASLDPTRLTAEGVVGGVLSVLQGRLVEGARGPYLDLLNPLMNMIVLPYFGSAAARRELSRPVPRFERQVPENGTTNPLKELDMRLTYRTVRVLLAIAEHPGASNRTVGADAGVTDQGQISKLLTRLEKLGLIANTGLGPGRGAPNSWTLTEQGQAVRALLGTEVSGETG